MSSHSVVLQKTFYCSPDSVFSLFEDGTVFKLTGANQLEHNIRRGGIFNLTFNDRGVISGKILELTVPKIVFEWNVEGFNRPDENATFLEIKIEKKGDTSVLILRHDNILDAGAASAKKRAWTEILDKMEEMLSYEKQF